MLYDDEESTTTAVVRLTSCGLSLLGSVFIILSYVLFPDTRTFGRKLLFILSTQDALASVAYAMPGSLNSKLCHAQSVLLSFFAGSSVVWTTAISYYMYRSVLTRKTGDKGLEIKFHVLCWTYATACAVVVALSDASFLEVGWCWVPDHSTEQDTVRFLIFYIPLFIAWLFNLFIYGVLYVKVSRILELTPHSTHRPESVLLRRLMFVPLVMVLIRLPGSVHRVLDFADRHQGHQSWLATLQAAGDPSQGFFDAILFGLMNKTIRRRMFRLLFCCRLHNGLDASTSLLSDSPSVRRSNNDPYLDEEEYYCNEARGSDLDDDDDNRAGRLGSSSRASGRLRYGRGENEMPTTPELVYYPYHGSSARSPNPNRAMQSPVWSPSMSPAGSPIIPYRGGHRSHRPDDVLSDASYDSRGTDKSAFDL